MNKKDNNKSLIEILSKLLDIDPSKIDDNTSPENTFSWDSYNGLMMVSELESNFNVHFTMDEVIAVRNVGDIKKFLSLHGVEL